MYREGQKAYENKICDSSTTYPLDKNYYDAYMSLKEEAIKGRDPVLVKLLIRWEVMRNVSYDQMCRLAREAGTSLLSTQNDSDY
jgi:hypothetical protein